ncbi:MAG: hypothetical protein L0L22_14360 [Staphylococcus equorum]|uniref:hypothetical protein n=2 Tax=Tetragenococcus halophilus TaxID=51669 RepID=UPI000CCC95D8|nr:hypothetical protein [Tetragenococcus halophilus]MDN6572167.1 hypothetical protein [Staphylococcus equorum]
MTTEFFKQLHSLKTPTENGLVKISNKKKGSTKMQAQKENIKIMLEQDYIKVVKILLEHEQDNGAEFINNLTINEVIDEFLNDDTNTTIFSINKYIK